MSLLPLTIARDLFDALVCVLMAPRCLVCDTVLDRPTSGPVCPRCWSGVLRLAPPLCDKCSIPLPSWRTLTEGATCRRCRRRPSAVDRAAAVGPYDGALRDIVHGLKYEGRRSLARPLAALMARAGQHLISSSDCVVPVPLHPSRRRARGFNQAADLSARMDLPCVAALRRVRRSHPQTGLSSVERRRNVRDAFALVPRHAGVIRHRSVLLIDDVATTGATLDACARVLKAAGARKVHALTVARAMTRPR